MKRVSLEQTVNLLYLLSQEVSNLPKLQRLNTFCAFGLKALKLSHHSCDSVLHSSWKGLARQGHGQFLSGSGRWKTTSLDIVSEWAYDEDNDASSNLVILSSRELFREQFTPYIIQAESSLTSLISTHDAIIASCLLAVSYAGSIAEDSDTRTAWET